MKKILLTLITFFALSNSFSQVIVLNPVKNSNPYGSALCGENILIKVDFPKTNESVYLDSKKIVSDTVKSYISINYYLKKNVGKVASQTTDSSILNSYITKFYTNPYWHVVHTFYLDSVFVYSKDVEFNPFATCFKYNYSCEKVSVMRNKLKLNCSATVDITKKYTEQSNDTLNMIYNDSTIATGFKCASSKYIKHIDTLSISNLGNVNYTINTKQTEIQYTICPFVPPCYQPKYSLSNIIGKADLSKCIPTSVDDVELNTIDVYPNPASDKLYITSKPEIIQLIDVYGQQHSFNGSGKYDVSQLKRGIYTVLYQQNGNMVREKLVIE
jgi:Secretion system C-terminal sorting domain